MKYEEKIVKKVVDYNGAIRMIYDTNFAISSKAQAALDLAKHTSMVMVKFDGEDSSGKQKMELMNPAEIAVRACNIADYLFKEFEYRGWLLESPDLDEPQAER